MATVCVYAASSQLIAPAYLRLAELVGTELARRGHQVVSGGGSVSMMGAVTRAARAGGARTVGVIPRQLFGREFPDLDSAELVEVTSLRERKAEMERRADAFLALPGGIGTLDELIEAWTSGYLGVHAKPVVVLDPDGFYAPLWHWLRSLGERGFVRPEAWRTLILASSVPAALDAVERALS